MSDLYQSSFFPPAVREIYEKMIKDQEALAKQKYEPPPFNRIAVIPEIVDAEANAKQRISLIKKENANLFKRKNVLKALSARTPQQEEELNKINEEIESKQKELKSLETRFRAFDFRKKYYDSKLEREQENYEALNARLATAAPTERPELERQMENSWGRINKVQREMNKEFPSAAGVAKEGVGEYRKYIKDTVNKLSSSRKTPEAIREYLNPYVRTVVDEIGNRGRDLLRNEIIPKIGHKYMALGHRPGGTNEQNDLTHAIGEMLRNVTRSQGEALKEGYGQAAAQFAADESRSNDNARTIANLGVLDQASRSVDAETLANIGARTQNAEQAQLAQNSEDYLKAMYGFPMETSAQLAAMLRGNPITPSTITTASAPPQTQVGGGMQGIAALANIAQMMGPGRGRYKKGGLVNNPSFKEVVKNYGY